MGLLATGQQGPAHPCNGWIAPPTDSEGYKIDPSDEGIHITGTIDEDGLCDGFPIVGIPSAPLPKWRTALPYAAAFGGVALLAVFLLRDVRLR